MLFMTIEHFRGGDPQPVDERFRGQGRLAPAGLPNINSWVTADVAHCYQLMECEDRPSWINGLPRERISSTSTWIRSLRPPMRPPASFLDVRLGISTAPANER